MRSASVRRDIGNKRAGEPELLAQLLGLIHEMVAKMLRKFVCIYC